MDIQKMEAELIVDEGKRYFPYVDSVGKVTIGIGNNLTDCGVTDDEIDLMFANDLNNVFKALDTNLPWWRNLDEVRQRVLVNLCFNMGIKSLLGFHNTLQSLQAGDFEGTAKGMEGSHWYVQVGPRGKRLVAMMRTGATI